MKRSRSDNKFVTLREAENFAQKKRKLQHPRKETAVNHHENTFAYKQPYNIIQLPYYV